MATVAITQDQHDIEKAISDAMDMLDLEGFINGRLVAIKPNDTWASADDTTAVTQGDSLRAVIQHVKRFSPRHIVITGGAGAAETRDVFRLAGMMQVIEEEGVEFFDHNRGPFREVALEYAPDRDVAGTQRSVMVNPRVLEYETLIALNQLKMHRTATVTLALKNIAMSYPAADFYGHPRGKEYHKHEFFEDMHSFIAAMAKRFHIDVAVTVGHPAMVGTGPIGGFVAETGICIAGDDALAADVAGAFLLGLHVQGVRHLWEAEQLGVGEADSDRFNMPGMSLKDAAEAFTSAMYGHALEI